MIAKSSKFPTRTQFLSFRSSATQFSTPHLRIMLHSHTPSRLSVIVPVKVSKRAVTRNSFKRLAYDSIWKIISGKNLDCIVLYKPVTLQKGTDSNELVLKEIGSLTCF